MRKPLILTTVFLLFLGSFSFRARATEQLPVSEDQPGTSSAAINPGTNVSSTVLFGLHPGATDAVLGTTLVGIGIQSVEPLFPDAPVEMALSRVYRMRLASASDVPNTLSLLMAHPAVDYVEVDQVAHPLTVTPDDPLLSDQWALTQIEALAAWDIITGTATVVIAMLDTGIDADHPDLVGRLWSNPGETPNNGIDDDGNGYIDDVHGWNFIAQTNEIDDDDGHGTKVAGAAVAETNNGAGIAGVCWNCRIMVVKVVQPGGFANYSDIALGIYYAVSKGADVINISLGGTADSATLRAAIAAASETAVIVAAAGDGSTSARFYPAAYADVLAVGGTTAADTRALFSNYGHWVDVAAPGVMITTTLDGGSYGPASGTSMAAPLVSGLAGLIRSQNPDWSPALVRAQIVHTADAIAATGLGSGRINAAAAVTQIPRPLLNIVSTAINDDALGRPTPGEGASLAVTLANDWLDATAVVGVLSTTDPYVTITNGTAAFGNIPAGGTEPTGSAYSFSVASGAGYNYPIPFTLNLSANSGAYTVTLPLTITTRSANEIVGGTIVTHTVWTSDKTYIVNNNMGVAPGITLTIQPGTVVRFNGNYNLNVGGTLIADGTQVQPIRFMSNSGSTWGRILFDNLSIDATATVSGTYLGGNILRWVWVESAGQGIGCNNATPYLSHVNLTGGGVNCTPGATILWVQDSTLVDGLTVAGGGQVWRNAITGGDVNLASQATVRENHVSGGISTGSSSLIQDNTAGGVINAPGASAVLNNMVSNGGISVGGLGAILENQVVGGDLLAGSSTSVMTNTVRGGGITVGDGSLVHSNDVEGASSWGISASGTVTVTRNRVVGSDSGVNVGSGLVQGNLIANSTAVGLQVGSATVLSNTLTGNGGNALVVASGAPIVQGNNLEFNRGLYDLVNNTANPVVASENWWGTTDGDTINRRIFDYFDDFNLGQVTYAPMLTGPVQDAPAYLRAVTLTPESPVGIETVRFDVLFSREMGLESVPQLALIPPLGWNTRAPMPTARRDLGAVAASNGKLYAIGGEVYSGFSSAVEEYDPATDTWTTRTSMPTARQGLAVAAAPNGRVYAIGGWGQPGGGSGRVLATVEEYDPTTDTWTTRASMPTARTGLAVATGPNGKLYAIGGNDDGNYLATVEEYDPATDTWITRAPMPTTRQELAVVAASNGKLYAIGGYQYSPELGGRSLRTVEEYDPTTDTWTTRSPMPTARSALAVAASPNGRLYAIGGWGQGESAAVEEYDPVTDTWTTQAPMAATRHYLAAATAPTGKLYAIGGSSEGIGIYLATVEEFSPWKEYTGFYSGIWSAPDLYRASYDFSALIPSDVYTLTVATAIGGDGIEIAPNLLYTFTVDYIGSPETIYPPTPVVRACASLTTTTLSMQWIVPTAQSIGLYRYAIGTAPDRSDVTNWITTTLTSVTRTNLNLLPGQTYYISVKARNTGGLWSDIGSSNGIVAGVGGCPEVDFTAVPTSGMAPLAVAFTPQVTGTVTSYIWSYGNDIADTQISPVYTYTLPGTYTVTLEVFGPGGWAMVAKEAYISVTPDTTPPFGTLTVASGAAHIATTAVTLTIAANDPSGLDGMRFSNNGTSYSPWVSYNQIYSWTLSSGDGPKTVYAQVRDVPGNTATFTDTIILDTTPPVATVTALPAFTGDATFTVTWTGADLYAGVADFDLQIREGTEGIWTDWLTGTTMTSAAFTGVHGATYYFRARARDMLDNLSEYAAGDGDTHTVVDLLPPVGSVAVNGGAIYTSDPSVILTLSATDLSGVEAFQVSNDGLSYSEWVSYTTVYSWTLTAGDGTKTVYARFRDMVGHESETVTDTIVLHTEPPIGSVLIADGAWATVSPSVTLSITATDSLGVADMCIANDDDPCTNWEPFVTWREWLLQPVDGVRTVTVQVRDLAGATAVLTDDILLDTTPPTAAVDLLSPFQTVLTFSVSWSGSDLTGIANFDIQTRQGDGPWSDWLTSTTALSATFTALDGHTYHFRARARDDLGNLGAYAPGNGDTSTHVDSRRPEGSISINGGAIDTTSQDVVLLLTTNDAVEMAFSDDGVNFGAWEPFAATRFYVLTSGDSLKTVSVRFRNAVGNVSEYSDTITLNTAIPGDVGVSINNDDPVTEQITVTLTIKAPSGTQYMMVSNSSRFATAEWEPYATTHTWVLAYHPYVTVYPVYVRFRNVDGTVSVRYDDIITLHLLEPPPPVDIIPPTGSMVINAGAEETASQNVTLDVLAADNPGGTGVHWVYFREWKYDPVAVQWVIVSNSGWLPYTENSIAWTLAPGTGVKYIGAWFADGANNVSNPVVIDSINLVLPGDTIGEAQVTQYRRTFEPGQQVSVTLTVTSGDADLYIWLPGSTAAPDYWSNQPGTATERLIFTAVDGEYLIEVHGYASSVFTLDIDANGEGTGSPGQASETMEQVVRGSATLANKPLPPHPLVITLPGSAAPDETPWQYIYLPLVLRQLLVDGVMGDDEHGDGLNAPPTMNLPFTPVDYTVGIQQRCTPSCGRACSAEQAVNCQLRCFQWRNWPTTPCASTQSRHYLPFYPLAPPNSLLKPSPCVLCAVVASSDQFVFQ